MPTGYTSSIKEGISFEQFVMHCARAFGACVTIRDDPNNVPIPEFKPSDYHSKELTKLQIEIETIKAMSIEEATIKARVEHNEKIAYNEKAIKENNVLRHKYYDMLAKVKNWQPPTSDHQELKNFMIQQITTSIAFDCGTEYYTNPIELLTGEQWLSKKKHSLLKGIDYHMRNNQEEINRVRSRNEWVKQLQNSLKKNLCQNLPI